MTVVKPVRGATVSKQCETCGDAMQARPADIARGWGRFCSKACAKSTPGKAPAAQMQFPQLPHVATTIEGRAITAHITTTGQVLLKTRSGMEFASLDEATELRNDLSAAIAALRILTKEKTHD